MKIKLLNQLLAFLLFLSLPIVSQSAFIPFIPNSGQVTLSVGEGTYFGEGTSNYNFLAPKFGLDQQWKIDATYNLGLAFDASVFTTKTDGDSGVSILFGPTGRMYFQGFDQKFYMDGIVGYTFQLTTTETSSSGLGTGLGFGYEFLVKEGFLDITGPFQIAPHLGYRIFFFKKHPLQAVALSLNLKFSSF